MFHRNIWAFVNLIPVAGQCSSAARIGPHHWRHRTGAVVSSGKHWHALLKHCLALLNTARVLWLKHYCQCCHWPQWCPGHCPGLLLSTALWPSHCFREMWKFREQCSKHCLPVLSLSVWYSQKSPQWTIVWVPSHWLGHLGTMSWALAARTRKITHLSVANEKKTYRTNADWKTNAL